MRRDELRKALEAWLDAKPKDDHTFWRNVQESGPLVEEIVLDGATECTIEIEVFPDRGDDLHVIASIDDGGWSAFAPVTLDWIVSSRLAEG